jgi:hypothetical protein
MPMITLVNAMLRKSIAEMAMAEPSLEGEPFNLTPRGVCWEEVRHDPVWP